MDDYRCFLIDPQFDEAVYITGTQVLPQNQELMHHAILSRLDPSGVEHARSVDAADEGDGWQCFGGTGLSQGVGMHGGEASSETYIGGWSPGHNETLLGDPAGYRVEPGSLIVLQVHYSLLTTGGAPGPTDQSSIRLRLMPGTADVTPLKGLLLPAPVELPCTAEESGPLCERGKAIDDLVKRTGPQARDMIEQLNTLCNKGAVPAPGPTQHCDIPVRDPVLLYAVGPHMHLLGRSIKVDLNPGTPGERTLLHQRSYNFDDQSPQRLPRPLRLDAGDIVRVSCTHDASLRSKLPELKPLPPRYVVWGDGTSDEMCLALLITATKF
ncbi:hypothetical protein GCM10023259_081330 [Thermocatellispora tengchongensis]